MYNKEKVVAMRALISIMNEFKYLKQNTTADYNKQNMKSTIDLLPNSFSLFRIMKIFI